jgi:hypothetical protein
VCTLYIYISKLAITIERERERQDSNTITGSAAARGEEEENNIEKTYGRRRDYLRVYSHMGCGGGLLCYRSYFSYC